LRANELTEISGVLDFIVYFGLSFLDWLVHSRAGIVVGLAIAALIAWTVRVWRSRE
jgi:hypothetical protein